METIQNNTSNVYTYHSAKKIYFTRTPSKYFLIEKKESTSSTKVLSLVSRNTVLISSKTGLLLFPKEV